MEFFRICGIYPSSRDFLQRINNGVESDFLQFLRSIAANSNREIYLKMSIFLDKTVFFFGCKNNLKMQTYGDSDRFFNALSSGIIIVFRL